MKAHDATAAELLVSGGLQALGLAGMDLSGLRKLDIRKQVVVWWVRKQTTVGNRWLSERLNMGDERNISKVIKVVDQTKSPAVRRLKKLITTTFEIPKSGDP